MNMKRTQIILMAVLAFSAAMFAQNSSDTQKSYEPLPGLDKALIDTRADPCMNFFKYACGNFNKLYPIPNDRSSYGIGTMIYDHNQVVLHEILEKAAAGGSDRGANEQKIGDFYAACMNTEAIDKAGLKPLQPELEPHCCAQEQRRAAGTAGAFPADQRKCVPRVR